MAGQGTRFFRTSRYEAWRRARLLAWVIPAVQVARAFAKLRADAGMPADMLASSGGFLILALLAVAYAIIYGFPLFFIWWCACTFMMSRARREATFSPTRDIEYYRGKLGGLTAAQVSMLADLRIEPREDAAATILSLVMDGVVEVEGDTLVVRDTSRMRELPRSSRLLVEAIANGCLEQSLQHWADEAECEAVDGRLLRWRGKEGQTLGCLEFGLVGCGKGCLLAIAVSVVFALVFMTGRTTFLDIADSSADDIELMERLLADPLLLAQLVLLVVLFAAMMGAFVLPLVEAVRGMIENGDASRRIVRTPAGEEATECVYGIRNYLRDFTRLPDADRATLMLWDEFAVYAVALGENPHAVDEILASRGLSRRVLGL